VFYLLIVLFYFILFKGVTSEQELLDPENTIKATYYVDSFAEFGESA
jgi:hypothetical protein